MTIAQILKKSIPYRGRKYENMTVLQRLRCDLYNEAADYDHTMLHAWTPYRRRKAEKAIGDELVEIAQNYAWRYRNHKMIELLDKLIEQASDNRINSKETIIALMRSHKEGIESDLKEYQQQFKNMDLM